MLIPENTCTLHENTHQASADSSHVSATRAGFSDIRFLQPTPGLQLAMDPHIPDELEAFVMKVPKELPVARVEWLVDGQVTAITGLREHQYAWPLQPGSHVAQARVWLVGQSRPAETGRVAFAVR